MATKITHTKITHCLQWHQHTYNQNHKKVCLANAQTRTKQQPSEHQVERKNHINSKI